MLDGIFLRWALHNASREKGELAGHRAARVADDTRSRLESMQVDLIPRYFDLKYDVGS